MRPDLVFPSPRVAVFVDGCFWHGCPSHGHLPASNTTYWKAKLRRNRERDKRQTRALQGEGWKVIRMWEHTEVVRAADEIEEAVTSRRLAAPTASEAR